MNNAKYYIEKWSHDTSLWFLFISNILTIILAVNGEQNFLTILWIYWIQSVTIGIFNFIRILDLQNFSTEGFKINNKAVQPTQNTKRFTAYFFAAHYGLFHIVYAVFIFSGIFANSLENFIDVKYILILALVFFLNHLFSYFYNRPRDIKLKNIGSLMFYPYLRIIPMHITIILGTYFSEGALVFFLVLKTFADCMMHIIEHQVIRGRE